jgi:hypothetical protein
MWKANLKILLDIITIINKITKETNKEIHGNNYNKNMTLNLHWVKKDLSNLDWKRENINKIKCFNRKEKRDIWKEKP